MFPICYVVSQMQRQVLRNQQKEVYIDRYKQLSSEKKIHNASYWVLGCKVKLPTFATLKTSFIYLTFFQPPMKIGMTQENTVYEQPGIWTFSKVTVGMFWLKWAADIRTCHYLSKGSWFWQQRFNCVEADDDILCLNRIKNKQNQ